MKTGFEAHVNRPAMLAYAPYFSESFISDGAAPATAAQVLSSAHRYYHGKDLPRQKQDQVPSAGRRTPVGARHTARGRLDRKSTRLNSSHVKISYAVFCLKKKKRKSVAGA